MLFHRGLGRAVGDRPTALRRMNRRVGGGLRDVEQIKKKKLESRRLVYRRK
jgi:hypothetical protein